VDVGLAKKVKQTMVSRIAYKVRTIDASSLWKGELLVAKACSR
jgi:hypothetical protein